MSILQAIVLGIVQGLTEFLPVSSSGHLAVVYHLLNQKPDLAFEVFLHAATLIALITYFRADIVRLLASLLPKNADRKDDRRLVGLIVVATGISGVLALVLSPYIESISDSMTWVGLGFLLTAALLAAARRSPRRNREAARRTFGFPLPASSAFSRASRSCPVSPAPVRPSPQACSLVCHARRRRASRSSSAFRSRRLRRPKTCSTCSRAACIFRASYPRRSLHRGRCQRLSRHRLAAGTRQEPQALLVRGIHGGARHGYAVAEHRLRRGSG